MYYMIYLAGLAVAAKAEITWAGEGKWCSPGPQYTSTPVLPQTILTLQTPLDLYYRNTYTPNTTRPLLQEYKTTGHQNTRIQIIFHSLVAPWGPVDFGIY